MKRLFLVILVLFVALILTAPMPVAANPDSMMTVVSDTTTMVTDGNVPAAIYPYNAVLAWQPFDPANNYWDTNLTGHTFTGIAKWIWESARVQNPINGDIVDFKKEFSIPGNPTAGTAYITCDNGYELRVNGELISTVQLGAGWRASNLTESFVNTSGWQSVETWNITAWLVSGQNTIEIATANEYMGPLDGQSNGTMDSNPAGLIYEIDITYEEEIPPPPPPRPPSVPSITGWGILATAILLAALMPLVVRRRALSDLRR